MRITAQLIDAETGAHLWADRFDGSLEDVFELQDQVAISVAGVIEPTLRAAEIRRTSERPTNDLSAYDCTCGRCRTLQPINGIKPSRASIFCIGQSSGILTLRGRCSGRLLSCECLMP